MYNNPNYYGFQSMYYPNIPPKQGLFSKLKGGVDWGNFLTNTSKTLNVINQAIPLFYQIKPLFQNAKTMFKIADIMRSNDDDKPMEHSHQKTDVHNEKNYPKKESANQPTFFL